MTENGGETGEGGWGGTARSRRECDEGKDGMVEMIQFPKVLILLNGSSVGMGVGYVVGSVDDRSYASLMLQGNPVVLMLYKVGMFVAGLMVFLMDLWVVCSWFPRLNGFCLFLVGMVLSALVWWPYGMAGVFGKG